MRPMTSAVGAPRKKDDRAGPFQWSPVASARVPESAHVAWPSFTGPGQCFSLFTHCPSSSAAPPLPSTGWSWPKVPPVTSSVTSLGTAGFAGAASGCSVAGAAGGGLLFSQPARAPSARTSTPDRRDWREGRKR